MSDDWKYLHYISQLQRTTHKVHENYVISSLFHDPRLTELLPLTQFYLRRSSDSYALIDLYYPQLNLAIEIDEPYHERYIEQDIQRELEVRNQTGCEFLRISVQSGDVRYQVEKLKKKILRSMSHAKAQKLFNPWTRPLSTSIEELKRELDSTLFVKIRGKIPEKKLLSRQTGAWRLSDKKRVMVDRVVVVHDRIISRSFTRIQWRRDPSRGNKWMFKGDETNEIDAMGSLISDWTYQATAIYSRDIENATT